MSSLTRRPPFLLFVSQCVIVLSGRLAAYGLIWGTLYGLLFFIFGAFFGAPLGAIFGALIGAINGLICGLILYCWPSIFSAKPGAESISIPEYALRWFIGIFSAVACLAGGYVVVHSRNPHIPQLPFISDNWNVYRVPALIACVCGYKATGHLVRWCMSRWVVQSQDHPAILPGTTVERG